MEEQVVAEKEPTRETKDIEVVINSEKKIGRVWVPKTRDPSDQNSEEKTSSDEGASTNKGKGIYIGAIALPGISIGAITLPECFIAQRGQRPTLDGDVIEPEEDGSVMVTLEKPTEAMTKHIRPLYLKADLNGIPINRVLVDNGAGANILPLRMLRRLGIPRQNLTPTDVYMTDFAGGETPAVGSLLIEVKVGRMVKETFVFVVDVKSSYNLFLGRDWIHSNKCIPSSMHQTLIMWRDDGTVEIVHADPSPFRDNLAEADAVLYDPDTCTTEVRRSRAEQLRGYTLRMDRPLSFFEGWKHGRS